MVQLPLYRQGISPLAYANYSRAQDFIAFLKNRQFYLRDVGLTSRLFEQWKKAGLLLEQSETRRWVTLSFGEYLWLKVVADLRMFGVALEDIKRIKDRFTTNFFDTLRQELPEEKLRELLFEIADALPDATAADRDRARKYLEKKDVLKEFLDFITNGPANLLEVAVIHMVVMEKEADLVLILTNHLPGVPAPEKSSVAEQVPGKRKKAKRQSLVEFFIDLEEFENMEVNHEALELVRHTPHIRIPLRTYIKEFIGDSKNEKFLEKAMMLAHDELLLLGELRKDHVTEITVRMNPASENSGSSINRIEITSDLKKDAEARLIETFTKREYADILYKVADGKIVSFKKTIKIKP